MLFAFCLWWYKTGMGQEFIWYILHLFHEKYFSKIYVFIDSNMFVSFLSVSSTSMVCPFSCKPDPDTYQECIECFCCAPLFFAERVSWTIKESNKKRMRKKTNRNEMYKELRSYFSPQLKLSFSIYYFSLRLKFIFASLFYIFIMNSR